MEKSRKRKATDEVKKRRRDKKYRKTNDDSLQACRDYARHDGGPEVHDAHQDVPADILHGMMLDYYQANIYVSASKSVETELATRNQGSADEISLNLWMAERRKRITGSQPGENTSIHIILRKHCYTMGTHARARNTTHLPP